MSVFELDINVAASFSIRAASSFARLSFLTSILNLVMCSILRSISSSNIFFELPILFSNNFDIIFPSIVRYLLGMFIVSALFKKLSMISL